MYTPPAESATFIRDFHRRLLRNARDLLGDAVFLFERGSYPRAAFLALSAIEEVSRLSQLRRPFLLLRDRQDLEAALSEMEGVLREFRTVRTTALEAPRAERGQDWQHSLDPLALLVYLRGREELAERRRLSLQVDADPSQGRVLDPAEGVEREEAYYFIWVAFEAIGEYTERAYHPFPLTDPYDPQPFDLWREWVRGQSEFVQRHGLAVRP
jgi:AbiV family abortive infection protein